MKILYVNPHAPKAFVGHKTLDQKMIEFMSAVGEVDVLTHAKGWYSDISEYVKNEYYVEPFQTSIEKDVPFHVKLFAEINESERVFYVYYVLKLIKLLNDANNYDCIYMGALDWCTFALTRYMFSDMKQFYLVVHNAEVFDNSLYRFLFYTFKNKINYVVTEKGAVEYFIKKYHLKDKQVHYIPHPMIEGINMTKNMRGGYRIVAISGSNDDAEIEKIILLEKEKSFFKKNNIKCIIRSKKYEYDNGFLRVEKRESAFEKEEYQSMIAQSNIVLLPFGIKYGFRTSGNMMDAISYEKVVIGNNFETMRFYEKVYPDLFFCYDDTDQLPDIILKCLSGNQSKDFTRVQQEHSCEKIVSSIREMLELM